MAGSEDTPSVPVLAYLYADRLVPKVSFRTEGTHVPCTDHRVTTEGLAVILLACACWSLRRQGLIQVEVVGNGKGRRVPHRNDVRVLLLERRDRPGLEGAVVASLTEEGTIREVISRWSAPGSTNPWHDVVEETIKEAITEGVIREVVVTGGVLTRFLRGEKELEPDCGRIAALKEQFDAFEAAWREFQTREKLLHDSLRGECKRALIACTECWIP